MMKIYLMEKAHFDQLKIDSAEISSMASRMTHDEIIKAKKEFIEEMSKAGNIFLQPHGNEKIELKIVNGRAQIPIVGQLTPIAEKDICGAYTANALTEYGFITSAIKAAESDESIMGIDFLINSPGGYVQGVDEVAQAIAKTPLNTKGYISDMCASAAFWISSQMDELEALGPLSRIGSIGVICEEYNDDAGLAAQGIKHNVYTSTDAPEKYADTNTDEGRKKVVAQLDQIHKVFVSRVSTGRNVSEETVNKKFGRGGLLLAADAVKAGMIDSVKNEKIDRRENKNILIVDETAGLPAKKNKGVRTVNTLDELKAENPNLYAQAVEVGKKEGIQAERKRREDFSHWKNVNAETALIAEEAIASGKTYDEVAARLQASAAKGKTPESALENAPDVASGTYQGFSEDDKAAAKMAGMSVEEYKKYSELADSGNYREVK
jgi:ClpP class serine protease